MQTVILPSLYLVLLVNIVYYALKEAYEIRLHAIHEYGRVIHEFDPYFNYRAAEYLWANGWTKFRTWFDYMSWYPLGRPVGTTIYPGMQVTSVLLKKFVLPDMSINDICCFVPAWFGALATATTGLLAYECSVGSHNDNNNNNNEGGGGEGEGEGSHEPQSFTCILNDIPIVGHLYQWTLAPLVQILLKYLEKYTGSTWGLRFKSSDWMGSPAMECGIAAACAMSIVPAHIMRSVGGGYDNECVAMFAMTFTFYCWTRSLRGSLPNIGWSVLAGLAYFYMVAAWGGYVFVLNVIGVHASILVLTGRYSTKLHRAYSIFYALGTTLAIQVPVVGWTPLKSLEQMGPLVAFVGFQLIEFCEIQRRRRRLSFRQAWQLRVVVFAVVGVVAAVVAFGLVQMGYFGPISARVRGLFVKHTKTGNPLVDSVAEHQPGNPSSYFQYLDILCYLAPVGFGIVSLWCYNDASSFLVVYGVAAYYFSLRMVRLILLTAPIASALGGIVVGHAVAWAIGAVLDTPPSVPTLLSALVNNNNDKDASVAAQPAEDTQNGLNKGSKKKKKGKQQEVVQEAVVVTTKPKTDPILVKLIRLVAVYYLVQYAQPYAKSFKEKCDQLSKALSHPTIIQKGRLQSGEEVMVDDYREAYWWLRDNTPEDARVMAWWDYGYQIAGIANRTTIADGNTWNHEHIALLGRALTSSVKEGHRIARHLADYVLVWAGGGGDDLAKSPHMRRIANSVYRFLCPGDPTCRSFGVSQRGMPSRAMEESLLYNLHMHNLQGGVEADKNRFKSVFNSRHGKVRIFKVLSVSKESKRWVADPANRICDAPGSWFCRGQYPPALQKILKEKKDFQQLEDFNKKGEGDDSDYTKQYLENLK